MSCTHLAPSIAPALAASARLILVGALVAAVWTDVRARRIPNVLTGALVVAGLAASAAGCNPSGLGGALVAVLVALCVWVPLYLLGMLGAGDVKLFAASAAWLTPLLVLRASALAAVVGGVLGAVWMMYARGAGFTLVRLRHAMQQPELLREPMPAVAGRDARVPYAVAMAVALFYEASRLWRGA